MCFVYISIYFLNHKLGCFANTEVDDIDDLEEKENDKIPQNLKGMHLFKS